ncbi:unnamed protein product [marine sediment metagenome]|uniref:Uncharacterized protein n=1 Tax=marine sediment metagenome TaxID=412755 RepID=X1EQE4_9ZZZZ
MEPQLRLEEAALYLNRGNFTIADIEVPGVGADQFIWSHTLQATTFSLSGSLPLEFFPS